MARVIVLPNAAHLDASLRGPFLLDERVDPVALEDEHSSLQFIERVAWAIEDAEKLQMSKQSFIHGDEWTHPTDRVNLKLGSRPPLAAAHSAPLASPINRRTIKRRNPTERSACSLPGRSGSRAARRRSARARSGRAAGSRH